MRCSPSQENGTAPEKVPRGRIVAANPSGKTAKRELLEETGYLANEIQYIYTYQPSVSKSRQRVHIFRAKDLIEDKSNYDGTEDIVRLEIVSIGKLENMIKKRRIQNAGTLIAYLICCTGIL